MPRRTTTVETEGLKELERAVQRFDSLQRKAYQDIAEDTGRRVLARAKALIPRKTGSTAAAIAFQSDPARGQVLILSKHPAGSPTNLPLWLEFGTVRAQGAHYMQKSVPPERARFRRLLKKASTDLGRTLFKG